MAQICAHKGMWSTRDLEREDGKDYSRAESDCFSCSTRLRDDRSTYPVILWRLVATTETCG